MFPPTRVELNTAEIIMLLFFFFHEQFSRPPLVFPHLHAENLRRGKALTTDTD